MLLLPGDAPKPEPATVTEVPIGPAAGLTELTTTPPTVKTWSVLLLVVPTVTLTAPVVAPDGTVATICVLDQLGVEVAAVPLKEIVPGVSPNPEPLTVTWVPVGPPIGDNPLIK